LELLLAIALALSFVMETLKSALNLMMLFKLYSLELNDVDAAGILLIVDGTIISERTLEGDIIQTARQSML
jgi:hypothetical protein